MWYVYLFIAMLYQNVLYLMSNSNFWKFNTVKFLIERGNNYEKGI